MFKFSEEECKEIIDITEKQNYWEYRGGKNAIYYLNNDVGVPEHIKSKIIGYCDNVLGITLSDVKLGVIKYKVGGYFSKHQDIDPKSEWNNDFVYNINVRLNNDYGGGDFLIDDEVLRKDVGDIYHYRSDKYHEVKPITHGVRYVALFYIRKREIIAQKSNLI